MSYTTVADLEAYLGVTLSTPQSAAATAMLGAVDAIINSKTGRVWQTGQQVQDFYQQGGKYLWVQSNPVSSIDSVYSRASMGDTLSLVDPSYYNLEDAKTGRIYFPGLGSYYQIQITYTPDSTLDERLKLAANIILAHLMNPVLNGISMGIRSYSVAGTITINYDNGLEEEGIPQEAAALLNSLVDTGFALA